MIVTLHGHTELNITRMSPTLLVVVLLYTLCSILGKVCASIPGSNCVFFFVMSTCVVY